MAHDAAAAATRDSVSSRMEQLGLSTEIVHTALRPGLSRAMNRTGLALPSSAGTDIYHDAMEQFALALAEDGWTLVHVDRQPRLLHPENLLAFTVSAGFGVGHSDPRQAPRTRSKGPATRLSLAPRRPETLSIFDETEQEAEKATLLELARRAPLWFLIHERNDRGLNLEFARPSTMTTGGAVIAWDERILLPSLDLDGDLSVFDQLGSDDFDVPVAPRR